MKEEALNLLKDLAHQLGTTAEYLWSIMVAQAFVSGIWSIILAIMSIAIIMITIKLHIKFSKGGKYQPDDFGGVYIVPMVFACIISIISFFLGLFSIKNMLTAFLNPEYWALKTIIEIIQP